nr:VWA domain-containing protein [Paracoccus saliphilus]
MGGLILLRPWWLAALLPWAALVLWRILRAPSAGGWENVMPPQMLTAMQAMGAITGTAGGWVRMLPCLALLPLILGLAGPGMRRTDMPVLARTDTVLIAVDLSPSITGGAALSMAQQASAALLQGLAGRPVGLILYGGEAYNASAPTTDPRALETLVAVLDAETVPGKGSRPAAAIGMAAQMLADPQRADLVLLSDGGGVDRQALAEADRLAALGVRIWTLRLEGLAEGAPLPPSNALARLTRGGGRDMEARDADRLAARLREGGNRLRDPALKALGYRDLGPFLAAFSAFPLLMMLRRQR